MSSCCSGPDCASEIPAYQPGYRRVLWAALVINAGMFLVEIVSGISSGSSALQADALDFLADAANYGISLFVLTKALRTRANASLIKGWTMALFGAWVIGHAGYQAAVGDVPTPIVMGVVGLLALLANLFVLILLYAYRSGDSNMRSVWICSRNDAVGNVAVMIAASGVFATGNGWPDMLVAMIMGALAVSGARQIIRHARDELTRVNSEPTPLPELSTASVMHEARL
ncbi:MAG: cation transporter [Gemmatimonadaceae bacterium]